MSQRILMNLWTITDSGYADYSICIRVADAIISNSDIAPEWLIDVSLCKSKEECREILIKSSTECGFIEKLETVDTLLGFLWLRYRRGDYSLEEFLNKAFYFTDSYSTSFDCEVYSLLLNKLKGGLTLNSTIERDCEILMTTQIKMARSVESFLSVLDKTSGRAYDAH